MNMKRRTDSMIQFQTFHYGLSVVDRPHDLSGFARPKRKDNISHIITGGGVFVVEVRQNGFVAGPFLPAPNDKLLL